MLAIVEEQTVKTKTNYPEDEGVINKELGITSLDVFVCRGVY